MTSKASALDKAYEAVRTSLDAAELEAVEAQLTDHAVALKAEEVRVKGEKRSTNERILELAHRRYAILKIAAADLTPTDALIDGYLARQAAKFAARLENRQPGEESDTDDTGVVATPGTAHLTAEEH